MQTNIKVAIVYDRVNKFGGAERVLLALRKLYPNSVLFTSVFDASHASWVEDWAVRTSFLQKIPFAKNHHEWFAPLMPLAFESLDFSGFDLVISVTSEFAKNILTTSHQLHVCYCLTPTRYLWSHTRQYGGGSFASIKQLMFSWLRIVDFAAAQRPQYYIAISKRVRQRIKNYYGREAEVIYPPTTLLTNRVSNQSKSKGKHKKEKHYLVVSRLVSYKRVELAIEACKKLKRHLVIVGTGSDGLRLLEVASKSPFIHFEGNVGDEKLAKLYVNARALICPQEEDFGLVSLEAQAHGIPVISYRESGVAETILDGKTGILFTDPTIDSLVATLRRFESYKWKSAQIRASVKRFSQSQFERQFGREIARLWKKRAS